MAHGNKTEEMAKVEIDYKTLSFFLPTYDGNKKTLTFYIKSVESALELIENRNNPSVACLIRNKLTGKAVEALSECTDFNSWEEIKSILTRRFGEFRDEVQIVQQLMNLRKDKCELEQFADKVRELNYTLINLDQNKSSYYDKMSTNVFLDQLNPILALIVRVQNPDSLEQAIVLARQEELKFKNRRSMEPMPKQNITKPNQPSNQYRPFYVPNVQQNKQVSSSFQRPQLNRPQGYPRQAQQPGPSKLPNRQINPAQYTAPVFFQADPSDQSEESFDEVNNDVNEVDELSNNMENFYLSLEEETDTGHIVSINLHYKDRLPYVYINELGGRFLIDTGATQSLISPQVISEHNLSVERETHYIKTAHGVTQHNKVAYIQLPSLFNCNYIHKFFLFEFDPDFIGLLGVDLLVPLGCKIDMKNMMLRTDVASIPKKGDMRSYIIIHPRCEQVVKLLSNSRDGKYEITGQINSINNLCFPPAFVTVNNGVLTITVINNSDSKIRLQNNYKLQLSPVKTEPSPEKSYSKSCHNHNSYSHNSLDRLLKNNLNRLRTDHMNTEEKREIERLCYNYRDIFYCEPLTFTHQVKHKLRITDDTPIFVRNYRQAPKQREEIQKQVEKLLRQNIIRESISPWSCPVHIVPKKVDASGQQKFRLVIDYRRLNEKTIEDKYPLPNINDILDKLGRAQYFTTLDLASVHHQVDTFHLVVVYNVSEIRDIYIEISRSYYTFQLLQKDTFNYRNSLVIGNQIEYLIDSIESKLVYLGSKEISLGRTYIPRLKRGLINGLGSIIKAISGNLDQEDAVRLETQINKNSETIGLMTDFIKDYQDKFGKIVRNQKEVTKTIERLANQSENLESEIHTMELYNQIETCLQQVYNRVLTLENAVTFCHLGRLHPSIVEPSHLIVELMSIEKDLHNENIRLPYSPTLRNIHLLEKSIVVKAYSTNESINFVLEIPLTTKHPYSLLHLYPVPNRNNAILIPINPYLILGTTEFAYPHEPCMSITDEDVICRHIEWHPLQHSEDCIAQLLQHNEPNNCTYATATYNRNIIIQIKENSWIVILKEEVVIKTTCGDKTQYQRSHGVALITMDNQCTIEIDDRTLRTHKKFMDIKETIPLPRTRLAETTTDSPVILNIEDVPLDNLNDLLKKTKAIQSIEEEAAVTSKPSWMSITIIIIITIVIIGIALRRYCLRRKPATPAATVLQFQEPLQQQQQQPASACFTLKRGGVTSSSPA